MNKTPDSNKLMVFDPNRPTPSPGAPLILNQPAAAPSKIIQTDASGRIIKEPVKEENLTLQPFSNGALFCYGPSGKPDGSCVMMDANNLPVALVKNAFIADFLCRGAHLFFVHLKEMQTTSPTPNENAPPADEKSS